MRQKGIFQFKQFTICQQHAAQKVGTDSDLLGALSPALPHRGGEKSEPGEEAPALKILDIGAGTGVLSLMMAQRFPSAHVTAVEIDDNAIIDLKTNIEASPFRERITMVHAAFQDLCKEFNSKLSENDSENPNPPVNHRPYTLNLFDAIVCNPPYFDLSLECPDESRTRARHSSSLPFEELIGGAYALLKDGGLFTVCIPPEVESKFDSICRIEGFWLDTKYNIKSVPEKPAKRLIITYKKSRVDAPIIKEACMRDADRNVSQWYKDLMQDFLL